MCSFEADSLWTRGLLPTRFLCPWNFPGKNTGVGCHFLPQSLLHKLLFIYLFKICSFIASPIIFFIDNWFPSWHEGLGSWKTIFPQIWGWGVGISGSNVRDGKRSRWSFPEFPTVHLLLGSPVPNQPWIGTPDLDGWLSV